MKRSSFLPLCLSYGLSTGGEGRERKEKNIFAAWVSISLPSLANEIPFPCFSFSPRVFYPTDIDYTGAGLRFPRLHDNVSFFSIRVRDECPFSNGVRRWIATLEAISRESRDVRFMGRAPNTVFRKILFRPGRQISSKHRVWNRNHHFTDGCKFRGNFSGMDPSCVGSNISARLIEPYRQPAMQISPKLDEKVMKSQIICGTTWKLG